MRILLSYAFLGMKYIAISLVIALLSFAIMYLLSKNKSEEIHRKKIRWVGLSLFNFCFILCVAFLDRRQLSTSYNLNLFSSYHNAVFSSDSIERINILLNIMLYIPLGMIFGSKYCPWKKWYQALTVGLLISVIIEFTQFITKMGYADIDDVFNNFSGVIIGYFLYKYLIARIKNAQKPGLYLLPIFCPIIIVGIFFVPYLFRPFGYLDCERFNTIYIESTSITIADNALEKIDINGKLPIYTTVSLNETEVERFAQIVFEGLGTSVGEEWTIKYDTCMVLFSEKREYELWYEYHDGTFTLQHLATVAGERLYYGDITESFVRLRLKELGIFIPASADFSKQNDTDFTFKAKMVIEDEKIYDGSVFCKMDKNGQIMKIEYKLLHLEYNSENEAVPISKIREKIEIGSFYFQDKDLEYDSSIDVNGLICLSSTVIYQVDTKGYYRPVYEVEAMINNNPFKILFPAVYL